MLLVLTHCRCLFFFWNNNIMIHIMIHIYINVIELLGISTSIAKSQTMALLIGQTKLGSGQTKSHLEKLIDF